MDSDSASGSVTRLHRPRGSSECVVVFLELAVSDGGSGVDPESLQAHIDEDFVPVSYRAGRVRVPLSGISAGRHALTFSVADYQETKNMENVPRILPNTRTLRTSFVVR